MLIIHDMNDSVSRQVRCQDIAIHIDTDAYPTWNAIIASKQVAVFSSLAYPKKNEWQKGIFESSLVGCVSSCQMYDDIIIII